LAKVTLDNLVQDTELEDKIKAHVNEFSWFGTHHWGGKGYDLIQCIEQINETLKNPKNSTDKVEKSLSKEHGETKTQSLFTSESPEQKVKNRFILGDYLSGIFTPFFLIIALSFAGFGSF
jgi:hypothetical protein